MFVTGPNVVKTVTHEEVTFDDLGGARTHAIKSGVSHFTAENEAECFQSIRTVSYTHLRAHETVLDLVCRLLLEKKQAEPQTLQA